MTVADLWLQLSWIFGLTTLLTLLFYFLKQPPIIAYIISGIILSPAVLNIAQANEVLNLFAEIGLALLLFLIGLHLDIRVFKTIGKAALITGVAQIIFTTLIGYGILRILGFGVLASWYIALGLAFSSTAIIVKLLSDKKDLTSLYGKISIGFLLVQDLVAFVVLLLLPGINGNVLAGTWYVPLIFLGILALGYLVIQPLIQYFANSTEIVYLLSLAWCFGVLVGLKELNLPFEIGTFLAGLSLASSPLHYEIASKLKGLRDFFLMIFFVLIGTKIFAFDLGTILFPALVLSLFVLIGNPLIVFPILRLLGYPHRVSFLSALTVSQISEFSLILGVIGLKLGHLSEKTLSVLTFVALLTIIVSTYFILYNNSLYRVFKKVFFKSPILEKEEEFGGKKIILFGADRTGGKILRLLPQLKEQVLIIDFNPEIISQLKNQGYYAILGDIQDYDFLDDLELKDAKLIVSTIPEFEDNVLLLQKIKQTSPQPKVFFVAQNIFEKKELEKMGADKVFIPQEAVGEYLASLIKIYL